MGLDLIGLIVISALSIIALLIVIVVGFKAAKENELEPKIIELITPITKISTRIIAIIFFNPKSFILSFIIFPPFSMF